MKFDEQKNETEIGGNGFHGCDQSTLYEILKDLKTFKKQINKIILPLPPALECALGLRIFLYNELFPCWIYIKGTHSANIWVSDIWR